MLDRTVEPVESAMRTDDPESYARFVIAVCDQLNSPEFGDWGRQDMVGKYARLALRHTRVLPPAAELHLLAHVWAVPSDDRREFAGRWLASLARLEREIGPTFDPADVPLLKVRVPGDDLPAGVAEDHVRDPVVRQRYSQADCREPGARRALRQTAADAAAAHEVSPGRTAVPGGVVCTGPGPRDRVRRAARRA
jgi:hypothetical protein